MLSVGTPVTVWRKRARWSGFRRGTVVGVSADSSTYDICVDGRIFTYKAKNVFRYIHSLANLDTDTMQPNGSKTDEILV